MWVHNQSNGTHIYAVGIGVGSSSSDDGPFLSGEVIGVVTTSIQLFYIVRDSYGWVQAASSVLSFYVEIEKNS